jgi:L-threonylcarbamoyladenylate synthase
MYQPVIDQFKTAGSIAVMPTDTIYGVVARATDFQAVERLYALKHREHKPGTIVAATIEQLETLGMKARYLKAVEQFWPGAVSVIIPCSDPALAYLHQGKQSLAVRIPNDSEIINLLQQTGPLLTSSANLPGKPPATSIEQAKNYFARRVDVYVDGGEMIDHQPSTVIRIVDDEIEIIRQGAAQITIAHS